MKTISTKNLYLCTLKKITNINCNIVSFGNEKKYILAKKGEKIFTDEYIDIFTKTSYLYCSDELVKEGLWCVREARPCITNAEYITEEQAIEILKQLNPTFFIEKSPEKNSKIKRLINKRKK